MISINRSNDSPLITLAPVRLFPSKFGLPLSDEMCCWRCADIFEPCKMIFAFYSGQARFVKEFLSRASVKSSAGSQEIAKLPNAIAGFEAPAEADNGVGAVFPQDRLQEPGRFLFDFAG